MTSQPEYSQAEHYIRVSYRTMTLRQRHLLLGFYHSLQQGGSNIAGKALVNLWLTSKLDDAA